MNSCFAKALRLTLPCLSLSVPIVRDLAVVKTSEEIELFELCELDRERDVDLLEELLELEVELLDPGAARSYGGT